MTTVMCYTLEEHGLGIASPVLRRLELVPVGRNNETKARSLSSSGTEWAQSVEAQISRLLELPANWDSYGASAIRLDAVDTLIKVLRDVMSETTPAPTIVPVADGHLQAEWHTRGVDLEVEVIDPLRIDVCYSGPDGEWNESLSVDLGRLTRAIDQLSDGG